MTKLDKNHKYYPHTPTAKLGFLAEECGEVIQIVGKSLRFGLDSSNKELPEHERVKNTDLILKELRDLKQAIGFVEEMIDGDETAS